MFTNRRPVLSPRTLKLLYQLGYICSGTACGLATLCLEEQRRRIGILQKVADNGKIIGAYLRYQHSVALPVDGGHGSETAGVLGGWAPERRISRSTKNQGALEAPRKDRERVAMEDSGHFTSYRESGLQHGAQESNQPAVLLGDHKGAVDGQKLFPPRSSHPKPAPGLSYRRVGRQRDNSRRRKRSEPDEKRQNTTSKYLQRNRAGHLVPLARSARIESAPDRMTGTSIDESVELTFLTKTAWRDPGIKKPETGSHIVAGELPDISSEDIFHDVDMFFRGVERECTPLIEMPQQANIADQLLRLALKKGTVDDVRALCSWKLANKNFSALDFRNICDSCGDLAKRLPHSELLAFYVNIFGSKRFQYFNARAGLQHGIKVLTNALIWDPGDKPSKLCDALLGNWLRVLEDDAVQQIVDRKCRELLSESQVSLAARLVLAIGACCSHQILFVSLVDRIFSSALGTGLLSDCASILRWKASFMSPEEYQLQIEQLIRACGEQKAYGVLIGLFRRGTGLQESPGKLLKGMSHESRAILALAFGTDSSLYTQFEVFYRSVPRPMRPPIHEASAIQSLKTAWKTTRNPMAIDAQLPQITKRMRRSGGRKALRSLHETLLEIYIEGNETKRALNTVARIHRTNGASSASICLTALLFAKRGAWELFNRMLAIAQNSESFQFDAESTRAFNKIIHIYSEHHSAVEIWNFVADAIEHLRFSPNAATTQVILLAFVSKRAIDLIPKWLKFLESLGLKFEINSRVATALLRRYYVEHRPSHVMMMLFCRQVAEKSPELQGEDLIDLVKQAIGYDLRKYFGQNAHWQRQHAQMRLDRVELAETHIPSPGYRWDEQLYFPGPDAHSQTIESEQTANPKLGSGREDSSMPSKLKTAHEKEDFQIRQSVGEAHEESPTDPDKAYKPIMIMQDPSHTLQRNSVPFAHQRPFESASFPSDLEVHGAYLDAPASLEAPTHHFDNSEERGQQVIEAFYNDEEIEPLASSKPFEENFSKLEDTEGSESILPGAHADFSHLREEYEEGLATVDLSERTLDRQGVRKLAGDMMIPFSLGDYQRVLDMYHETLDAAGVPASPMVLEIAVEASLRLRSGDSVEAGDIMVKARSAGMNITCAMGPMLIHQMRTLNPEHARNVSDLRSTVIDYYRMNDENGWGVKHFVGVAAADTLIKHGRAKHGLNILSAIFHSEWAKHRPLDIAAMTMFLKGYVVLQSIAGIRWVVETVLHKDMRIDMKFMHQLRFPVKGDFRSKMNKLSDEGARPLLVSWVEICHERWSQQIAERRTLGWRLARRINSVAERQASIKTPPLITLKPQVATRRENSARIDSPIHADMSPAELHVQIGELEDKGTENTAVPKSIADGEALTTYTPCP